MKKLYYSSFKIFAAACAIGFVTVSCEKQPATQTPGKSTGYDTAQEPEAEPVLPVDTIPVDTVKKPEPEVIRVASAETSELINYMDTSEDADKYASGILHRMAYDSPEYTRKLLNSTYSHFIIVDKQAMQLALFDRFGREELRYGIACGKNFGTKAKKGDCRTSEGFFSAEGIYDSTDWLYTDDNGRTSKKKGQFGPRFVRLLIPETRAIGIHGTCAPGSIGRRTSHGCIRVKNDNILELVKHVTIGMPIIVSPSDRDVKVNKSEGRYIAQVTINPKSKRNPVAEKEEEKHRYKDAKQAETLPVETPADSTETPEVKPTESQPENPFTPSNIEETPDTIH